MAPPAFRGLRFGGLPDLLRILAFGHIEGDSILGQHDPQALVLQMVADQQQGMGLGRLVMVGTDPQPGQLELDGQGGAAFRPDEGKHAAAVQVFHAEDPEDPHTEQHEAQKGGQDHHIVGRQQPFPDGQIFPAHRFHNALRGQGTPFFRMLPL